MTLRFHLFFYATIFLPSVLFAQHNDIEFGYDNRADPTRFLLSALDFDTTTRDGVLVIRSNMAAPDPFAPNDFAADQPGFTGNISKDLLVNPGDSIMIKSLDASVHSDFGVGYINYYNPITDSLEATGRIAFKDNSRATPNLVLNGGSIESGLNPQFIGVANSSGYVHDHISWDLLDDNTAPTGAYGLLIQLQSDFSPFEGSIDLSSDPVWLVFNHGMSESDFEDKALPRFIGQSILGDFDDNGEVNLSDLDRYVGNIGQDAVGEFEKLDLNGDGTIGADDFAQHYGTMVETSNGGQGTFQGDVNLDGSVDVLGDAFVLVGGLGKSATSWSQGDVNASGSVDVLGDAFALVGNLGNSNVVGNTTVSPDSVPKP